MVFMANSWFLSDKINDAFIVVDTDSYAGVSVLYENQKMGTTDSNGHLLIPSISSYYPAKVEIRHAAVTGGRGGQSGQQSHCR